MTILSTLLALTLTLPPQSNDFTDGQLVLLDPTLDSGIAMIDPLSGAISEPYSLHDVPFSFDVLCYDPYRERILFPATPLPGDPRVLLSGDAQGNFDVIGFPDTPCQALAPVGDGRVYFRLQEDPTRTTRSRSSRTATASRTPHRSTVGGSTWSTTPRAIRWCTPPAASSRPAARPSTSRCAASTCRPTGTRS